MPHNMWHDFFLSKRFVELTPYPLLLSINQLVRKGISDREVVK